MIIGLPIAAGLGAFVAYFLAKRFYGSPQSIEAARIKAAAIEKESEIRFSQHQIKLRESEIELEKRYEKEASKLAREYDEKALGLEKRELVLAQKLQKIEDEKHHLALKENAILSAEHALNEAKNSYHEKENALVEVLSNYTALSIDEAKSLLLVHLEDNLALEKANLIRRYEKEAKEDAKRRANYIIALATSRYAGDYGSEKLIQTLQLPNDEMKGRIIGKEGRNIKALEMITGVDILIDETPNTIVLSSFNLYRRAIALNTINLLMEDGRIHPARIEEAFKKCSEEMEQNILNDGENTILDLGLSYMHPELKKLVGKMKYRASYGQNALSHSIEVAQISGLIAGELDGDENLAKRAGLLHDIGKSLTHELGGNHVSIGHDLAVKYKEHPIVLNAILAHHGNEDIKSIECAAVCAADALSSARPGARRDVLENYLKRVNAIEKIAQNRLGVRQAYAINAGREVRVIVKSSQIDDKAAVVMAREIAREIELNLQYPGEIKVNVIRETRAAEFARQMARQV